MRKLILTSFKAKTGDVVFSESRLVVVNHNQGDNSNESESRLLEKASDQFISWFKENYKESELIYVIPHATIGEQKPEAEEQIEMYSREALVSFGNYLLSNLRKLNHGQSPSSLNPDLGEVYHADIENWLHSRGEFKGSKTETGSVSRFVINQDQVDQTKSPFKKWATWIGLTVGDNPKESRLITFGDSPEESAQRMLNALNESIEYKIVQS